MRAFGAVLVLLAALVGCSSEDGEGGAPVVPTAAPCTVWCSPCDGDGEDKYLITPWCGTAGGGNVDEPVCFDGGRCFYGCFHGDTCEGRP